MSPKFPNISFIFYVLQVMQKVRYEQFLHYEYKHMNRKVKSSLFLFNILDLRHDTS